MARRPEIIGDKWFNSKPLKSSDLAGKIVLVDFWTYSCVNCLRTIPHLKSWQEKYKNKNFVLIGVHTPEFEFEKTPENVKDAIKKLKITWPVVLDNEYYNWNNFINRYWPAKYLSDKDGNIVYTHFGEGGYKKTEEKIRELLKETGKDIELPLTIEDENKTQGAVCFPATPEIYCGYLRGNLANTNGYEYDQIASYRPPDQIPENSIALSGDFLAQPEYIESISPEAGLFLKFKATEINMVAAPAEENTILNIFYNIQPLSPEIKGKDINSISHAKINRPGIYNLIKSDKILEGILTIRAHQGNFQAYAFTFSGCEKPV